MRLFKSKTPKVEFYHPMVAVIEHFPICPAHKFPMPWRKKLARHIKTREKTEDYVSKAQLCSGISKLLTNTFVICAPMDYKITTNGDLSSYEWRVPRTVEDVITGGEVPVDCFLADVWGEHVDLPDNTLKTIIKFNTYWGVSLPKGWGLMISPSTYFEENRFTATSGLLAPEQASQVNIPVFWHVLDGTAVIKAGTPLALLTLVQLDKKPDYLLRVKTEKDFFEQKQRNLSHGISFTLPSSMFVPKIASALTKLSRRTGKKS
jgi:hypothetical protein|tara:strand:- start:637 stop:1422 length:786 start_codon:yes stop_codon:yes gene_type:complete